MRILISVALMLICQSLRANDNLISKIEQHCTQCNSKLASSTGAYILEKGEDALISRAWLSQNATKTIDAQYFIWSSDNIGTLSSEGLLSAAEKGVKVRVIVDDLLVDANPDILLALASHQNIQIKIYNPNHSVGTSTVKRIFNIAINFRGANQRMHDKTAIFDNTVGITGGRNMASEYFDYNKTYNFKDRDILLLGSAVKAMTANFEEFWSSDLSVPVQDLLTNAKSNLSYKDMKNNLDSLHNYAKDNNNYSPEIRKVLDNLPSYFPEIARNLVWGDVTFISDSPGKNDNAFLLSGGGQTTSFLAKQLSEAKNSVLIQSPYLIFPDESFDLLDSLIKKGVTIRISTNSLASTDNLMAFSGYQKQREKLLKMGVEIYEFMPHPSIQKDLMARYANLKDKNPIFAIHAKSMVIDDSKIFIGTFNLDPRSSNLNTEVGVFIENKTLAAQLTENIERDMSSDNSWKITKKFNPDSEVDLSKRIKAGVFKALPLKSLL